MTIRELIKILEQNNSNIEVLLTMEHGEELFEVGEVWVGKNTYDERGMLVSGIDNHRFDINLCIDLGERIA